MRAKSESRNPGYLKALSRNRESKHMRALIAGDRSSVTSLRFVTARFANLGDLDEISQVGSWHTTLCTFYSIPWQLTLRNHYATFRPQFVVLQVLRPRADVSLAPPSYSTGLDRLSGVSGWQALA